MRLDRVSGESGEAHAYGRAAGLRSSPEPLSGVAGRCRPGSLRSVNTRVTFGLLAVTAGRSATISTARPPRPSLCEPACVGAIPAKKALHPRRRYCRFPARPSAAAGVGARGDLLLSPKGGRSCWRATQPAGTPADHCRAAVSDSLNDAPNRDMSTGGSRSAGRPPPGPNIPCAFVFRE